MWSTETVEQALDAYGQFAATLSEFVRLYTKNRELFFQLACTGVRPSAPGWMREAAVMAAHLRALAFRFELTGSGQEGIISNNDSPVPPLPFTGIDPQIVQEFMRSLDGFHTTFSKAETPEEKMMGQEVTRAYAVFHFGSGHNDDEKRTTYLARKRELSSS